MKRIFFGIAVILLLWLAFVAAPAWAAEVTLSWTAPTQNEDGSPLTDLAGFKIYRSTTTGGPYAEVANVGSPTQTTYTDTGLADGTYFYVATAYNTAGTESAYSGEASKTVTSVPAPPENLTVVEPQTTAYAIAKIKDDLMLLAVGTVPGGTPCKSSSVNGKNVVETQYVEWSTSNNNFAVVVADCG